MKCLFFSGIRFLSIKSEIICFFKNGKSWFPKLDTRLRKIEYVIRKYNKDVPFKITKLWTSGITKNGIP